MEVKQKYEEMSSDPVQSQENQYEMVPIDSSARRGNAKSTGEVSKQSAWNTPLVVITILLCLILFLLVVILSLSLVLLSARDATSTSTATAGAIACSGPEWSDDIVNKVISNLTGSLPDFNQWANGVVSKVNQNLPDFDEWANGVVSKVNQSLPDFDQWVNGVVSQVNSNVTGSLPDFNLWANGVVTKVKKNLPDFDQWANGVVSKVNQSLPDFDQWTNGVVSKVNQGLPDFDQWANGVVSKVNQSLPDFDEWANGVAQNTIELLQSSPNFTVPDEQILQTTRDSAQKLINIVNTLSKLEETSTSTAGVVDDILLIAQELLVLHNDSTVLPLLYNFSISCKQLKSQYPSSPSGYYVLASANGSTTYIAYCNMGLLCGSGGWTRLAYLDMTDSTQNCPSGFILHLSGGVRACGRAISNVGSCTSVQFPSNGISYSQICGRVT